MENDHCFILTKCCGTKHRAQPLPSRVNFAARSI